MDSFATPVPSCSIEFLTADWPTKFARRLRATAVRWPTCICGALGPAIWGLSCRCVQEKTAAPIITGQNWRGTPLFHTSRSKFIVETRAGVGLASVDHDGNRARPIRYTYIIVGSSLDVPKAIIDRIQLTCTIGAIVLKKLHDPVGTEQAFIEEITDNLYFGKPHVSAANNPAIDQLSPAAGIKHDLAARSSPAPLGILIQMVVWET